MLGEYQPGSEIDNSDDAFDIRFLYAFWRLCAQEISVTASADVRHAAQLAATKHGVSADVRVVQLRTASPARKLTPSTPATAGGGTAGWCGCTRSASGTHPTSATRSSTVAPYLKGPDDKPLLGGEVVCRLSR
ncbi:hypothetical protein [Amycolatopsis sp. NPDC001319]|uniref:hypothetical protein n=1 Tax=unclassified Amycolatopsis TaxID=2618356 RepID=UPI0036BF9104